MRHGRLLRDYNSPNQIMSEEKIGACANSGYQALLSASAKSNFSGFSINFAQISLRL